MYNAVAVGSNTRAGGLPGRSEFGRSVRRLRSALDWACRTSLARVYPPGLPQRRSGKPAIAGDGVVPLGCQLQFPLRCWYIYAPYYDDDVRVCVFDALARWR